MLGGAGAAFAGRPALRRAHFDDADSAEHCEGIAAFIDTRASRFERG
jgi:hypothetical protein